MNALTAAKNKLEEGEKIVQIMQITVYVNSEPDFTKQPKIADFASESISARSLVNLVLEAVRLSVLRFFREKRRWRLRSLRG